MRIDVRDAVVQLTAETGAAAKQVRFATRVALTRTAKVAEANLKKEMKDVFRNPTPYTLSSLFVRPATAANLTAEVKLKDSAMKATPASKFLGPQVSGGLRTQKRFERALQAVGALPVGYRIVPGAGAKIDAFGNMSRGQIIQILAFFRAFPEAGFKANMTAESRAKLARGSKARKGFAYFVGTPGDRLALGIYQRVSLAGGTAIKPVMIFVRSAVYQPVFDFEYVVHKTVEKEFAGQFAVAYAQAKATAR